MHACIITDRQTHARTPRRMRTRLPAMPREPRKTSPSGCLRAHARAHAAGGVPRSRAAYACARACAARCACALHFGPKEERRKASKRRSGLSLVTCARAGYISVVCARAPALPLLPREREPGRVSRGHMMEDINRARAPSRPDERGDGRVPIDRCDRPPPHRPRPRPPRLFRLSTGGAGGRAAQPAVASQSASQPAGQPANQIATHTHTYTYTPPAGHIREPGCRSAG